MNMSLKYEWREPGLELLFPEWLDSFSQHLMNKEEET